MVTWAVYYDDGSRFTSEDGAWDDAPVDGVICVVRRDGERTEFSSGGDYYWHFPEDASIVSTSDLGPLLRKLRLVKFGRYTSHRNHEAIMRRAREEWR